METPNGQGVEKGNGVLASHPGKNYEILRRTTTDQPNPAKDVILAEGDNGVITDDKAVKPKEIVKDIPSKKLDDEAMTNGSPSPQLDMSNVGTAELLKDDGWSTVSKPRNNRRNGNQANQAARAIAS